MVCDSLKSILPHMEVFIGVENQHITFINCQYALEIVGNSSEIHAYIPDEDDEEILVMSYDIISGEFQKHYPLINLIVKSIHRDIMTIVKSLEVLK
jgi:hypothetical protein